MRFIRFLFLGIVSLAFLGSYASATEPLSSEDQAESTARSLASAGTKSIHTDYMKGDLNEDEHGDGYIKPTFERLSQLYWALAMLDLKDDQAIDGYLKLHECDLYKQFYLRDFELEELRKVTRNSIVHNLSSFPTKFEIFMPVGLERYDINAKQFEIGEKSRFLEAKKLEVSRNSTSRRICGENFIKKYPRNFILYFNRPFTLTNIPMTPETAQEIINFAEEDQKKGPKAENFEFKDLSPLRRIVFLRLQVTMSQYKEMGRNYSDEQVPVIFGTIDGYQIYFDKDRMRLIYDREIEAKRKMSKMGSERKMLALPEGPLLEEGEIEKTTVPQSATLPVPK